jgi:hypothetical protein
MYDNPEESGFAEASGDFIGMDADESYRDVFMRSPEASANPDLPNFFILSIEIGFLQPEQIFISRMPQKSFR